MTTKGFASTTDTAEQKLRLAGSRPVFYAFTAEVDPHSGIIIGDDGVLVVDRQRPSWPPK